jgi:hypothetical protein
MKHFLPMKHCCDEFDEQLNLAVDFEFLLDVKL